MAATSAIRWRSFFLHKDGNQPEEYEDAFAGNPKVGRFAVADGASESSFASLWAKLLVEGYVGVREGRTGLGWMSPLQHRWAEEVDQVEVDWFGEEKRQAGAFATFLGLSFKKPQDDNDGRWQASVVGDCCLFQVRDGDLVGSFPLSKSSDFGIRPQLICSRAKPGRDELSLTQKKVGRWKTGDRFFLMTDALAQWFLGRNEEKRKPWESLLKRVTQTDAAAMMTAYVEQLRSGGELKNDDVTLVVIGL